MVDDLNDHHMLSILTSDLFLSIFLKWDLLFTPFSFYKSHENSMILFEELLVLLRSFNGYICLKGTQCPFKSLTWSFLMMKGTNTQKENDFCSHN